jgi:hypothetical protein
MLGRLNVTQRVIQICWCQCRKAASATCHYWKARFCPYVTTARPHMTQAYHHSQASLSLGNAVPVLYPSFQWSKLITTSTIAGLSWISSARCDIP